MSLTFIDTNKLSKRTIAGQGEVADVLNQALCGAQNVHASLRWLKSTETFRPETMAKHQLIYLMEGKGRIRLDGQDYEVGKGAGIYLGPSETATIKPSNAASLKLFHLIVPQMPK
jgi:hypothetical protein